MKHGARAGARPDFAKREVGAAELQLAITTRDIMNNNYTTRLIRETLPNTCRFSTKKLNPDHMMLTEVIARKHAGHHNKQITDTCIRVSMSHAQLIFI